MAVVIRIVPGIVVGTLEICMPDSKLTFLMTVFIFTERNMKMRTEKNAEPQLFSQTKSGEQP